MSPSPQACSQHDNPERLNRECFCITLNRDELCRSIGDATADPEFCAAFVRPRPHLFSNTVVFLSEGDISRMLRTVRAVEAAILLAGYRERVLSWAPEIARHDPGPQGVLMGFDFHLAPDGPRLIEINTNAGGAFLNALLAKAQRACCTEVENALGRSDPDSFDSAVWSMFEREWRLQGRIAPLRRVAIVDDQPQEQYLYPEFVLVQRLFLKHGIDAVIADAARLRYERGELLTGEQPIELLYNRLVDFPLQDAAHAAIRAAYVDGAVVVTPNPHVHALYADKRNMTLLSDPALLRAWGLPEESIAALADVPRTVQVTPENARDLWETRKRLFFKPACGYGSKAVYQGDKLTKGVWADINRSIYIAQEFARPSERMIRIDGVEQACKTDVRLYVYDGQLLLAAARLYQGQVTNFRTPGGGFAPVLVI
jgi:hypothetical protein